MDVKTTAMYLKPGNRFKYPGGQLTYYVKQILNEGSKLKLYISGCKKTPHVLLNPSAPVVKIVTV